MTQLLKRVKVTNNKNVVVQVPGFIATNLWYLENGDKIEMLYKEDTKEIVIRPKKGVAVNGSK